MSEHFLEMGIEELRADALGLEAKLEAAERRCAKAETFKAWVHQYLDSHGVPYHPPGVHGAEGCRIGDRMDWLMNHIAELESQLAQQAKPVDWEAIAHINWRTTWNTNGTAIEGWAAGAKAVIAAYTTAQSEGRSRAQDKAND